MFTQYNHEELPIIICHSGHHRLGVDELVLAVYRLQSIISGDVTGVRPSRFIIYNQKFYTCSVDSKSNWQILVCLILKKNKTIIANSAKITQNPVKDDT